MKTICLLIGMALSVQAARSQRLILGAVDFPTSAAGDAQEEFVTGVLALHSFWYEEARDHFLRAQRLDSKFGMAYWGEAMTHDNALASQPREKDEGSGSAVIARMDALDAGGELRWTGRERGFADAVRQRFREGSDWNERRQAYANAMSQLSQRYPDDDEVTAFTALALMSLPGFDVENPKHVVTVAGRLEQIYERNHKHPGVLHYLVHVYDTPDFALMGLRQARIYADIAPASSHALHMPSHIFRHLGMWDEIARLNERAYQASVEWQQKSGRPLYMRDYHALDWLLDAYLNLKRYEDARRIMELLDQVEAEIKRRGEAWGDFPKLAEALRTAYKGRVPE